MSTKVTIIGEEPVAEKIVFERFLDMSIGHLSRSVPSRGPATYKNIELIKRGTSYDIMFAYDDHRNDGIIVIGHFNLGQV